MFGHPLVVLLVAVCTLYLLAICEQVLDQRGQYVQAAARHLCAEMFVVGQQPTSNVQGLDTGRDVRWGGHLILRLLSTISN